MSNRPERPSATVDRTAAGKAAERLRRTSPPRLGAVVTVRCHRAVKMKCAAEGISTRKYLLGLLDADGIDTGEPIRWRPTVQPRICTNAQSRPSATVEQTAAEKLAERLQRTSPPRLGADVTERCHRAVMAKCAAAGISFREYLLALLEDDGIDIGEPSPERPTAQADICTIEHSPT